VVHAGLPSVNCSEEEVVVVEGQNVLVTHATPTQAINIGLLTVDQLREYDCYAFLRDPYERYVSAFLHNASVAIWKEDFHRVTREHGAQNFQILNTPQKPWFFYEGEQVVTPLDFRNYDEELRGLIARCDGFSPNEFFAVNVRKHLIRRRAQEPLLNEEMRSLLRPGLKEDVEFYESVFPGRLAS
jgi:hypothetical protein